MLLLVLTFSILIASVSAMAASSRACLVVDFDGTITKSDTTPLLPKLASLHAADDETTRQARLETFRELEQEYFRLYLEAKESTYPHDLEEALTLLDNVSTTVTRQVSQSRCLAGLPLESSQALELLKRHDHLREASQLQEGCGPALTAACAKGWELSVLSINWCPSLIQAVLEEHVNVSESTPPIWSNSVDEHGIVKLDVPGASAKKERIASLRRDLNDEKPLIVYIGDSQTDLLGLLEADIGIVVGQSQTLTDIAKQYNIQLSTLSLYNDNRVHRQTIWRAKDWSEIKQFLLDFR